MTSPSGATRPPLTSPAVDLNAFITLGGSIRGREHVRLDKNNQDAVAISQDTTWIVAAVADGCSSGQHTEIGARLAVRWLTAWIPRRLGENEDPGDLTTAQRWCDGLAAYLATILAGLHPGLHLDRIGDPHVDPPPTPALASIQHLLLFGFLVAIVGQRRSAIIGVGDGLFSVNGEVTTIDPGPENAPPYLAYRLAGAALGHELTTTATAPRVHFAGPTAALDTLLIATDGAANLQPRADDLRGKIAGELTHFERESRYLDNPSLLQKRLRLRSEHEGRLHDDTTIALLRRRPERSA